VDNQICFMVGATDYEMLLKVLPHT